MSKLFFSPSNPSERNPVTGKDDQKKGPGKRTTKAAALLWCHVLNQIGAELFVTVAYQGKNTENNKIFYTYAAVSSLAFDDYERDRHACQMPNNSAPLPEVYDFDHTINAETYAKLTNAAGGDSRFATAFGRYFLDQRARIARILFGIDLAAPNQTNTAIETCIRTRGNSVKFSVHIISTAATFRTQEMRAKFSHEIRG